jgi:hypothetical protein
MDVKGRACLEALECWLSTGAMLDGRTISSAVRVEMIKARSSWRRNWIEGRVQGGVGVSAERLGLYRRANRCKA